MDTTPQQKYLELKARFSADQWERLPLELQLYGENLDSILRYFTGSIQLPILDTRAFSDLSKELQGALKAESELSDELASKSVPTRRRGFSQIFGQRKRRKEIREELQIHAAARARTEAAYSATLEEYAFLGNLKELSELIDLELMGFALAHEELFTDDRSERLRNIELLSVSNLAANRSMANGLFSAVQHLDGFVEIAEMKSNLSGVHLGILERLS